MHRLGEMAEAIGSTLARYPDPINKVLLAEAWGRLRERGRQESLLLDIVEYSRGREDAWARYLGAVAYLELGEAYSAGGEKDLAGEAYSQGLALLEGVPEQTLATGGDVKGRRPVSVERLARLREAAHSANN